MRCVLGLGFTGFGMDLMVNEVVPRGIPFEVRGVWTDDAGFRLGPVGRGSLGASKRESPVVGVPSRSSPFPSMR